MFWMNGFCFKLNERKGENFFNFIKIFLYRNAYNPQFCSVFTIKLVKSYTDGEI